MILGERYDSLSVMRGTSGGTLLAVGDNCCFHSIRCVRYPLLDELGYATRCGRLKEENILESTFISPGTKGSLAVGFKKSFAYLSPSGDMSNHLWRSQLSQVGVTSGSCVKRNNDRIPRQCKSSQLVIGS